MKASSAPHIVKSVSILIKIVGKKSHTWRTELHVQLSIHYGDAVCISKGVLYDTDLLHLRCLTMLAKVLFFAQISCLSPKGLC